MKIVARNYEGETHECASVGHVCSAEYMETKVSIYKSTDCNDCGGIVIRMTIDDPWFNPYIKLTDSGCEIHVAGDCESSQLTTALSAALKMYR